MQFPIAVKLRQVKGVNDWLYYDHAGNTHCIHVLVYNCSDPLEVQMDQCQFWLSFLQSRIPPVEPLGKFCSHGFGQCCCSGSAKKISYVALIPFWFIFIFSNHSLQIHFYYKKTEFTFSEYIFHGLKQCLQKLALKFLISWTTNSLF